MVRLIGALMLVLLIVSPSFGQQSLVGTYKFVSYVVDIGGAPIEPMGKTPRGYLVLTPTRAIFFYTGDNRNFGTSVAEKAALFDTVTAWSGPYRVEGAKIIIAVDLSWVENWNGKDQVRKWTLSGNRLTLTSDPQPYGRDPSKTAIITQVWEKIE
ncbi:MAG TPA: lipocalin-like domain-containing protein [Syntrophorhabdales bacterium]|nr:lipocalin-like domain-containing protein [Syntrophorhabdales bacterium]